jgi:hypothetical protein
MGSNGRTLRFRPPRLGSHCRGKAWAKWDYYPVKVNDAGTPWKCSVCWEIIEPGAEFYAAGEAAAHVACGDHSDAQGRKRSSA